MGGGQRLRNFRGGPEIEKNAFFVNAFNHNIIMGHKLSMSTKSGLVGLNIFTGPTLLITGLELMTIFS